MRVLYFTEGYSVHDVRFLRALVDARVEMHLLSLVERPEAPARAVPAGVIDHGGLFPKPPSPSELEAALPLLIRAVRSIQPDLVHAGPVPGPAWLAASAGCRPLMSMSWGSDMLLTARTSADAAERVRTALAASAAFVCDCETVSHEAVAVYDYKGPVICFPWGVELERYTIPDRTGRRGPLRLISLRAFEPLYRVETVVVAMALLKARGVDCVLGLGGDGSERPRLEALCAEHGLDDRVVFLGRLGPEQLRERLSWADLYVSTSSSDGSSVSLLEAMAMGLPAAVTDIEANREWITDGNTGLLFPVGDAGALSLQVQRAAVSPAWRASAGLANRKIVEAKADWTRNVQKLIEGYQLLARDSGPTKEWSR